MINFKLIFSILFLLFVNLSCDNNTNKEISHLYGTWENMEVDKCASGWLLKRHVDTLAEFIFIPVGQIVDEAVPFDTPDAELRRTVNQSAFRNILAVYELDDPTLNRIGEIIDELELKSWEVSMPNKTVAALYVDSLIRDIIANTDDPKKCFNHCFEAMDLLYERILNKENEFSDSRTN